jgi:moderate conductance mechanosensitive channel
MNWDQIFSSENLLELALPVGAGIIIIAVLIFLRRFLYMYVRKLASKTKTRLDDILIHETKIPIILWCIWLGIFSGFTIYAAPESWSVVTNKVIPVLFTALGIYTLVMIIMATFMWYKEEICPRTSSSLDDIIMGTLVAGTPVIGSALGVIIILNMLGIGSDEVNLWLVTHGPKVGILTVVTVSFLMLAVLAIPKIIDRAVRNARSEQTEQELKKRSDTRVGVIVATTQIVFIFMYVIMLLTEMNINVTAVLTGAGVLGLAVGFGAQSLVKDVISGLFIILENQYRKGDVIKIAGESGVVEEINLRRTILRDFDGVYHVVPNGEIKVSSNFTKQWSRVNLNVSVAYETDLEKAIAVINRVGKEMSEDPRWAPSIISPPAALRVDNLGDSGIEIKIVGDTRPSQQWAVAGELRLRLKKAFDQEGIDIPYPHTKVFFGNQLSNQGPKDVGNISGQKSAKKETNS